MKILQFPKPFIPAPASTFHQAATRPYILAQTPIGEICYTQDAFRLVSKDLPHWEYIDSALAHSLGLHITTTSDLTER